MERFLEDDSVVINQSHFQTKQQNYTDQWRGSKRDIDEFNRCMFFYYFIYFALQVVSTFNLYFKITNQGSSHHKDKT
jgi:hypothetical protein